MLSAPLVLGLSLFAVSATPTAFSDAASLVGENDAAERWRTHMIATPAGSLHSVEIRFTDSLSTGAIGSGLKGGDGSRIALRGADDKNGIVSDEKRVNRLAKKGRVLSITPIAPPKNFAAGSILERTSSLVSPKIFDNGDRMAFMKPELEGREIEVARAFYNKRAPKTADPGIPAMLADLVTNEQADVLATAYAPPAPDFARQSPFASILREEEARGRFIPPVDESDHFWAATPLPARVFSASEQRCLAEGIYFEARGESLKGQAAVAQVVLNRVRNPEYPDTICGVVYQNESWRNRCQFSFACDGRREKIGSHRHWEMAEEVAMAVTAGKIWLNEVGSSTHYHATYVRPHWARSMKRMGRIGLHVFYRTYGGGWS